MLPSSVYKLKLAIMAECGSRDKYNNNDAEDSCGKEFKEFPSAGEGSQPRWKNINSVQWRVALVSCMLMAFVAWCIFYSLAKYKEGAYFFVLISVSSGITATVSSLLCLDILQYKPSSSHTAKSLLCHYLIIFAIRTIGWLSWLAFQKATKNPERYQHELLMKILKKNSDTVYGKKYDFNNIHDREDFKKKHPLTNYSHYGEYITRIMNGERNVMTKEDTVFMAMTSGTTADPKVFPIAKSSKQRTMWVCFGILYKFRSLLNLGRTQDFRIYPTPRKAPNGLAMGGVTLHLFKPMPHHVTPPCYNKLYKEKAAFYAHAVFLLAERDMRCIEGYSSNLLYSFFKFVEQNNESICSDIERGEISQIFGIPDDIKDEMTKHLHPDPERASFIRQELSRGIKRLARRIWPRLHYVTCAKTGGFQHCAKLLQQSYLHGVKMISVMHVASEGNIGAMVEDDVEGTNYTFLPHSCFLEFIPEEQLNNTEPDTLFLNELERGKRYEIVVTTENGLCRYRLGDVVHITGSYNDTPSYTFEHRTGQILNVAAERTPESIIYTSLRRAMTSFPKSSLIDYTTTESFNTEAITGERSDENCYVFYVEYDTRTDELKKIAKHVDECLCEDYEPYNIYREKESITPLKVIEVKLGTFDELKGKIMGQYTNSQFKQPRVIRNQQHLEFLSKQAT